MIKLTVTGHRPNKLYGYNYKDPRYQALYYILVNRILKAINEDQDHEVLCISGMALGADMIFAFAAIHLKSKGYNVHLLAAIPFKGQESRWPRESINMYNDILDNADEIVYVCKPGYVPYKMQKRNEYMVDLLCGINDKLIAIWDGSSGGTANCVNYAKSMNINIEYINPNNILV